MIEKLKELRSNSGFMKYFKNTSWLLGEKVLRILAALTVGVWVIRYLGPSDYGTLSYAQSFVGIFAAFSTLGLSEILSRDLVNQPEKKYVLIGTSFFLQIMGSGILLLCLFGSFYLNDNDDLTKKIIIIIGLLTFISSFNVINSYFLSIVKNDAIVLVSILNLVFSIFFKVCLIYTEAPLIYFVYVLVFDTVFLAVGAIFVYLKNEQSLFKWKFSFTMAKVLLKDSWPLILNLVFVSIYMQIDKVMIKELMNASAVGQYSAAVSLSQAWYFIPTIVGSSLFPAIINAKKISKILYYDRVQKLYDLMVILAISIALPLTFLSDFLVDLLFGNKYLETGAVLSIHIWAGVFVFLGVSGSKWTLNENLQRYSSLCLFIGMISNIVLNIVMIPIYGIIGAALATLFSQSISVIFAPLLFKKMRPSIRMMFKSLSFISIIKRVL
jgi:O-antigen/teichoic acid export membrane protein